MSGMKIKLNRSLLQVQSTLSQDDNGSSSSRGKKRSRAGSEVDDGASDAGSGPKAESPTGDSPPRTRPKRKASSGVDALIESFARRTPTEPSEYGGDDPFGVDSDEEMKSPRAESPAPRRAGGGTASAKSKGKRRIESDDEEFSGGEDDLPAKPKGRGIMSNKAKPPPKEDVKIQVRDLRKAPSEQSTPANQQLKKKLPARPSIASSSTASPAPALIKKPAARPTNASLPASADLDLTNMDTINSLFQPTRKQTTNEPQTGTYEAMRTEARKARQKEAEKTFDLMEGSEMIRAFEIEMERMSVWPLPQVLLCPLTLRDQVMAQSRPA